MTRLKVWGLRVKRLKVWGLGFRVWGGFGFKLEGGGSKSSSTATWLLRVEAFFGRMQL